MDSIKFSVVTCHKIPVTIAPPMWVLLLPDILSKIIVISKILMPLIFFRRASDETRHHLNTNFVLKLYKIWS